MENPLALQHPLLGRLRRLHMFTSEFVEDPSQIQGLLANGYTPALHKDFEAFLGKRAISAEKLQSILESLRGYYARRTGELGLKLEGAKAVLKDLDHCASGQSNRFSASAEMSKTIGSQVKAIESLHQKCSGLLEMTEQCLTDTKPENKVLRLDDFRHKRPRLTRS